MPKAQGKYVVTPILHGRLVPGMQHVRVNTYDQCVEAVRSMRAAALAEHRRFSIAVFIGGVRIPARGIRQLIGVEPSTRVRAEL